MKMAISVISPDEGMSAVIDPRFGRARHFLLVDIDKREVVKKVENIDAFNMGHGAGIKTASKMVELGVDAVGSGFVGPKAFSVLSAAGIKVYSGLEGSVSEAIEKIASGEIQPDSAPSSNGHW